MDDLGFILGCMAENTDALGFIPAPTIQNQYLAQGRYIMAKTETGKPVGYLLHGNPAPGGILSISQHCIEFDQRLRGYGREAFLTVLDRAQARNCRAIKLRCASDLDAIKFWAALGFEITKTDHPDNRRQREVHTMLLDLWPMFQTIK